MILIQLLEVYRCIGNHRRQALKFHAFLMADSSVHKPVGHTIPIACLLGH